jgi:hypothetical protein
MSPAQAYLLGGYYLHTAYSAVRGGKRTQKKNGKSKKKRRPKKRPWQNDGNKKYPAWRLLLCPELWPSVLQAGAALFAVLNALHSAAKEPGRNDAAYWSPEAVRLYQAAAVLITNLPLIGEYQLAKIMRNAICWYARLMHFTFPPSSTRWVAWDKMSPSQHDKLEMLRIWSGEALLSPRALVAFIRAGGADLPPLAKRPSARWIRSATR